MQCECGCGKNCSGYKRFIKGHNMFGPNLLSQTFGNLKVIKLISKNLRKGKRKWLCECVCGKRYSVPGHCLTSGKSSGCRSCNNGYKKRPYESLYNMLVLQCKNHSTDISLTYDEYLIFTNIKKCHYCKIDIIWKPHANQKGGYKLDRKDNNKGYSVENCVVCCPRCNWSKSNHFTYSEWVQLGKIIRSWNKEK
jgi:hypothetical protein